jgi:uncharacterized membrane protein YfcA
MLLILFFVALGSLAGLLAGLLGVGGGILIVPCLVYSFKYLAITQEVVAQLAVGTSLTIIVFTSLSATYMHSINRAVNWHLFISLVPGLIIGAVLGVIVATALSGSLLEKLIGFFLIGVAVQFFLQKHVIKLRKLPQSRYKLGFMGVCIGLPSAVFGIGGGILTVPWLTSYGVSLRYAIATSASCGMSIALVSSMANIVIGWGHADLPEWSLGYIYLPAIIGVLPTSMIFATLGAKLVYVFNVLYLRIVFSLCLLISGVSLVFS